MIVDTMSLNKISSYTYKTEKKFILVIRDTHAHFIHAYIINMHASLHSPFFNRINACITLYMHLFYLF